MKQNKMDYQGAWPKCVKCGEVLKTSGSRIIMTPAAVYLNDARGVSIEHATESIVSSKAYDGLGGICNECLMKGVPENGKA